MNVRVKLFAAVRDVVGKEEVILSTPRGATAFSIVNELARQFPGLGKWKNYVRVAVNWEYVPETQVLNENDEVAVIPPVSGG